MTEEIEQKRQELLHLVADECQRLDKLIDARNKELEDLRESLHELEVLLNYLES